jgi:protoheme IX farnesyltransferase
MAGGLLLAPDKVGAGTAVAALVGVALIVAGANALNMVLERDIDRHMARTRNRPLPAGRLAMRPALVLGVVLSVVSLPILAFGVNLLTALLAGLANILYVLAYTPLKQRSHLALEVGAIPGAMPPLLGWTAATGRVDAGGLVLMAILFFWQLPHFHAIAFFRRADYARAGLQVLPNTRGDDVTKHAIVRYLAVLVAVSLLLFPLGIAGRVYLVSAEALGAVFFAWGCWGLRASSGNRWARSLFGASILYEVALTAAIVADAALRSG